MGKQTSHPCTRALGDGASQLFECTGGDENTCPSVLCDGPHDLKAGSKGVSISSVLCDSPHDLKAGSKRNEYWNRGQVT
jgi:hypothetical protein